MRPRPSPHFAPALPRHTLADLARHWSALARLSLLLLLAAPLTLRAQSNPYDSLLGDSSWYVPAENLLAYFASGTDLTDTIPVADQTIWTLGACTGGIFSGTSNATFQLGPLAISSTTTISGLVTETGQMRMAFSSTSSTTIGIGQIRNISGTDYVEMQMITQAGDSYVTHWAYMAQYIDGTTTLPDLLADPVPADNTYAWLAGTNWALDCPDLFPSTTPFTITTYDGGYFWGTGTSGSDPFTLIGSATPEGNLLFSILSSGTLTSLSGQISGTTTNGAMAFHTYSEPDGFATGGAATVVPEPSALALLALVIPLLLWHSRTQRQRTS